MRILFLRNADKQLISFHQEVNNIFMANSVLMENLHELLKHYKSYLTLFQTNISSCLFP